MDKLKILIPITACALVVPSVANVADIFLGARIPLAYFIFIVCYPIAAIYFILRFILFFKQAFRTANYSPNIRTNKNLIYDLNTAEYRDPKNNSTDNDRTSDPSHKHSSPNKPQSKSRYARTRIFGILFAIIYIGLLFGGMLLFSLGSTVAGGIVFGGSFLWIIVPIVISQIAARHNTEPNVYSQKAAPHNAESNSDKFFALGKVMQCDNIPLAQQDIKLYRLTLEVNRHTYSKIVNKGYCRNDSIPLTVHKKSGYIELLDKHSSTLSVCDQARFDRIAYAAEHPTYADISSQNAPEYLSSVSVSADDLSETTSFCSSYYEKFSEISKSDEKPLVAVPQTEQDDINTYKPNIPTRPRVHDDKARSTSRPNIGYKGINRKK